VSVRSSIRIMLVALAALSASGCTLKFTHRCEVPEPVVEAAPGPPRLPLAVEVRHAPSAVPAEVARASAAGHVWVVDAAPPTQALFARLAASMFAPAPDPARPADAVLEIRLDRIDFELVNPVVGPYRASVGYRATFQAPHEEIAALDVAGEAEVPLQWRFSNHCDGIGRALAVAMQEAGAALLGKVTSDPAVVAFFAGRGAAVPAFSVRPAESYEIVPARLAASPRPPEEPAPAAPYADPTSPYVPDAAPAPTRSPEAASVPVSAGIAMPPRSFQVRVGLGLFRAEETAGKLEEGGTGISVTALGAEYRPMRALGLALEVGGAARDYSARTLPPAGGFAVPRGIHLSSKSLGFGVRAMKAGGPVEPWVGATAQLIRTELASSYSVFGLDVTGEPSGSTWSAGLDLGAGLAVFPGGRHVVGLEVRRLFARARFDPFPGNVGVGGLGFALTYGVSLP
jgi:hypothetical protein